MAVTDPLRLVGATVAGSYTVESLVQIEPGTVVYRATDLISNRTFAVRVLAALSDLPESRRRVLAQRLAQDVAQLADLVAIAPGAYPVHDVGAVGSPLGLLPFVVLDWPHGLTLRQLVQPRHGAALPDSLDEVVAMIEPVAVALALAHERGVVHGGITPERVLFREDGPEGARRATLLDFGVARVLRAVDGGTEPAPADDVRALASILAQLVARTCGADGRLDADRSPRARGVVLGDAVEAVFVGALQGTAYATVGGFWAALRRALGLTTLRSLEATIPPEPGSSASRSIQPIARSTPPAKPSRARSRVGYGLGGLTVAALVAVALGRASSRPARTASAHVAPASAACPPGMLASAGGRFRLGTEGDADEPSHDVTLHPFCVDRAPVTTEAYAGCNAHGACPPASTTNEWEGITADDHEVFDAFCTARDVAGAGARPANCVTWEMAAAFCAQRGARLPTEAEWELAARSTPASIAEWVADWRAPLSAASALDPTGPARGAERVVRGAHGVGVAAARFGASPGTKSHAIGFRCARSP